MNEYKNIEKIKPALLLSLVNDVLYHSDEYKYIKGTQPFLMSFRNQKYYVYVKNISSAYFPDRDKTTRAQLPIKEEFDLIKTSPYPFVFLGYDSINDVLVCWNFHIAKERLNVGKSVSFYSRSFFQSEVKEGQFLRRKLKNGDEPVFFKRANLIEFFQEINTFFFNKNIILNHFTSSISETNYEGRFINYLKNSVMLSEKSIKNYSNALRGRITKGLRDYYIPSLESIFYINDLDNLEELNKLLFQNDEFRVLNKTGKNMYSCAFDYYIRFMYDNLNNKLEQTPNIFNLMQDNCIANGKLRKITDAELLNQIQPLIESKRLLSAAQIVGNYYKDQFPNMELSDWINLVRNI